MYRVSLKEYYTFFLIELKVQHGRSVLFHDGDVLDLP